MRFKLLLFTLLCSLAAILPAKAETLTVYNGTTTNQYVPAYIYYWDDFTRSEFVIPAADLADMAGGTISAITFYTSSDNVPYISVSQADFYLTEVDNTSLSAYVTKSNSTIVYHGTISIVSVNGGGEVTITFSTPYTYGGGNLLIGSENTTDSGFKRIYFYGQTVNGASIAGSNSSSAASASATQRDFIPKTTFTYTPGSSCKTPTNLTASNVVYDGATLTWTPGDAEQDAWQVVYGTGNFDPDAATPVNVTGNATYTLTGLTENTTYHAYVRGNCGGEVSLWSQVCTFTTSERYARPTNLAVSDITAHTAKASWTGNDDAQSYNLRYRKVLGYNETFSESFETFPGSWTIIDSDGDGYNWGQVDLTTQFSGNYSAVDGTHVAMSRSWINSTVGAVQPDNWLISPQVDLGGVLKYYVMDESGYPETYRIYVSTTGNSISDFQPITNDLNTPGTSQWTELTADLSAYEGQRGYIAFRHYNCYDQSFMFIDAVSIGAITYGEWVEVDGVTSPYTITGLDAETDYVVQVQGVYDEGNSAWSNSLLFTTAGADAMPIDLAVTDVTDTEATATWVGSQDSYNLHYRKLELTSDFEDSSIGGWTTIDADGDGYNWVLGSAVGGVYLGEGASMAGSGHSPQNLIVSGSYSNVVGALTPDNYLVSPKVQLGGTITFWAKGQDANYPAEKFGVAVSTSGNTNAADFTMVGQTQTATADWVQYEFDLSAYTGQEGYVAIRHYDITDMFLLDIDDIYISAPGGWVTINNVTSPYTIEGLDPETDYEVQVQGILDNGTTNWTNSVYFTTLMKRTTLAEICQNGVITEGQNEYVIADKLIAVYADDVKGILWCKDQGNASVFSTFINDGQVDFLKNDPEAQNGRDWDQSNWIALHFSTPTATNNVGLLVNGAVNRYIKPGTVKGKLIDDVNYALRMDLDQLELVTQADDPDINPDYIPNVYCPANFMPTNLNIWGNEEDGGYTEGSDQNYFFMNPKIQEICEVTYAQWDARNGYFTVPTASGFDGAFYIGTGYNVIQSQNFTSSLQDEHIYKFKAIVQRSDKDNYGPKNVTTPATGITLYPVDLDPESSEIPTAINTIRANGEVVGVEYVNSLGVVSKTPFQGVNIIVTRYSDGSTTTVKKIFK